MLVLMVYGEAYPIDLAGELNFFGFRKYVAEQQGY
jgi:hypothetical protein